MDSVFGILVTMKNEPKMKHLLKNQTLMVVFANRSLTPFAEMRSQTITEPPPCSTHSCSVVAVSVSGFFFFLGGGDPGV